MLQTSGFLKNPEVFCDHLLSYEWDRAIQQSGNDIEERGDTIQQHPGAIEDDRDRIQQHPDAIEEQEGVAKKRGDAIA